MQNECYLRVPFYAASPETQITEAWAWCQYAQYCDQTISARMTESYMRAWDPDSITVTPTVSGLPGYVTVKYSPPYRPRALLAIRGYTALSDLLPIRNGHSVQQVPGISSGTVYSLFRNYANTLYTNLLANPVFMAEMDNLTQPFVFTGFSLGAAIATIVGAMFRVRNRAKKIRVVTFASPRIGTPRFFANDFVTEDTTNIYVAGDPMQWFPVRAYSGWSVVGPVASLVTGTVHQNLTLAGADVNDPTPSQTDLFRLLWAIPLTAPIARNNRWWFHQWNSYRYAICSMARRHDRELGIRITHLETNQDNIWGRDFQDRMNDWGPLVAMEDPPPADFDAKLPNGEVVFNETIRPREVAAQLGDVEWSGGGGGGDVDVEDDEPVGGQGGGGVDEGIPPIGLMQPLAPLVPLVIQRTRVTRTRRTPVVVP